MGGWKDKILEKKHVIVRLLWLASGLLPAFLLWKKLGASAEVSAETLARPLALAIVWSAAGLFLFLKGKYKVIAKGWVSLGLMGVLVWVIFDRSQTE